MSTSLTPERLAALRAFAENTARLPSGAPVHVEPSELLALLDAADDLARVREALRRAVKIIIAVAPGDFDAWLAEANAALVGGKGA